MQLNTATTFSETFSSHKTPKSNKFFVSISRRKQNIFHPQTNNPSYRFNNKTNNRLTMRKKNPLLNIYSFAPNQLTTQSKPISFFFFAFFFRLINNLH